MKIPVAVLIACFQLHAEEIPKEMIGSWKCDLVKTAIGRTSRAERHGRSFLRLQLQAYATTLRVELRRTLTWFTTARAGRLPETIRFQCTMNQRATRLSMTFAYL
jgi:hypothetical protein